MKRTNKTPETDTKSDEIEVSPVSTAIDEMATDVVHSAVEDTRVDDIVNAWYNRVANNTPISRNTAALNFLRSKMPSLITALKE